MNENPISDEPTVSVAEQEFYERAKTIYNELKNTKLMDSLIDLRKQFINRISKLDNEKLVWKELGKLWLINHLIDKKQKLYNEIKRIDSLKTNG